MKESPQKDPSIKELRQFGITMALAFFLLFYLLFPWLLGKPRPSWPFYVATPFLVLGLVYPLCLKPIQRLWLKLAETLGWINSRIILGIFFYVIFTPIAFIRRAFKVRPDVLEKNSNWVHRSSSSPLERPY